MYPRLRSWSPVPWRSTESCAGCASCMACCLRLLRFQALLGLFRAVWVAYGAWGWNLIAAVGHGLALSNSFAAIVHGLSFANSFGAFRFQLLRFRATKNHQNRSKSRKKKWWNFNMIFDRFLVCLGWHFGSLWAPKSIPNRLKFGPRRLLKRYMLKNVIFHENI